MSLFTALVLGIIQGLTEFIPVSSTAHLTVAATAFGVIDPAHPERWTAFMATMQLGTLAAVIGYFRSDILRSVGSWMRENIGRGARPFREQGPDARLGWFVIIGTVPIVIVGLALKDILEGTLTKELWLIGSSLIGMAILLWIAESRARFHRTTSDLTMVDALTVGAAQCLALIPGSSRSGSTMMAALFRGMTREHAARFSFLLSIPAIFAAGVLEFVQELDHIGDGGAAALVVSTLAALVSGYASIAFLLKYLRTHTLRVFIIYRIALGAVLLITGCTPERPDATPVIEEMKAPVRDTSIGSDSTIAATDSIHVTATDTVVVRTSMGTFRMELYGKDAPATVRNFLALAGRKFYDGLLFHRVSRGFVIQVGDPKTRVADMRNEWGTGGQTASGEPLPDELDQSLPTARRGYVKGVVAMARKPIPNSATSQFFICLDKATALPYQYAIFGYVIDGLDVVERIGAVDVEPGPMGETDGIPRAPISIRSITKN